MLLWLSFSHITVIVFSQVFRVDTFEYRLLHEVEFRQAITQRAANEQDVSFGGPIQGVPQAPQLQQKPRATKVPQGNNATFTVVINGEGGIMLNSIVNFN